MSAWRREALSALPECRRIIELSEGPMALWIELRLRFEDAVSEDNPDFVDRILRFADWCLSENSGALPNDTSTAVAVAFYEHLPQKRSHWRYFSKWFSRQQFADLLPVFSYHLSEEDMIELKRSYANAA